MAGKSTISITFKLDGDAKGFKELINGADGLKQAMSAAVVEAKQLEKPINFTALATGINTAVTSLSNFKNALKNFSAGYEESVEQETKLATVMRQRMNATDEEIESIKRLALEQRNLGVVDDMVTIAGAQQLGTFLTQKQSIETLIPALNNLVAQQKGVHASLQDGVNVGNLMGKVMQGQVSALTRVGVTFSEAEKEVLQFGTEEEKAAMLAQVITNNVGNMNEQLGKTDLGKQQRLSFFFDDIQDSLAELVHGAQPILTMAAQTGLAFSGAVQLTTGLKAMTSALTLSAVKSKAAAAGMAMLGLKASRSAAVVRVFGAAMHGAAFKATALKIALRGVLMATGVGAAIAAVTAIIEHLGNNSDEAAEKQKRLREEMEETDRNMRDIANATASYSQKEITALNRLYEAAKDETKSRGERIKAMTELAAQYPKYFGGLNTEKINVADLTTQYNLLRDSILDVARAKAAQDKIEQNVGRQIDIEEQQRKLLEQKKAAEAVYKSAKAAREAAQKEMDDFIASYDKPKDRTFALKLKPYTDKYNPALKAEEEALKRLNPIIRERNKLAHEYYELGVANNNLQKIVGGTDIPTPNTAVVNTNTDTLSGTSGKDIAKVWTEEPETLKQIEDDLAILRERQRNATAENIAGLNQEIAALEKKEAALRSAGLEDEQGGNKGVEEVEAVTIAYDAYADTLEEIENNITILDEQLKTATIDEAAGINTTKQKWIEKAEAIRRAGLEYMKSGEMAAKGWEGLKGMNSSLNSLTAAVKGNGNAWEKTTAFVDAFIAAYKNIKTIIEMIHLLTTATNIQAVAEEGKAAAAMATATKDTAATGIEIANSAAKATASSIEAAADTEAAAAKVMKAHAWMPFVGVALAAGMVATLISTISKASASVPKFASGGLISGPTLGLIGEYPRANVDPEVVAPLSKLRQYMHDDNNVGGKVVFKIEGRTLVGILNKEENLRRRV